MGITPLEYTFHTFTKPNCVYVKLPTDFNPQLSDIFYIGSTSLLLKQREANRVAKLRQLRKRMLVNAEPALK